MPLKNLEEGDRVIYNNKSYIFDKYLPDYKVQILLKEDEYIKVYSVSLKLVEKEIGSPEQSAEV